MRGNSEPVRIERWLWGTVITVGLLLSVVAAGGEPEPGDGAGAVTMLKATGTATAFRLQGQDGKALFAKHCVSCHGAEGRGDGTAGRGMKPPPPDIANPDFLATITDDSIATVVRDGRNGMKPLGKVLTRPQIRAVIAYLRELGKARAG